MKGRVTQDPRTLLATEHPEAAAPVVAEPAPVLAPAVVVPADARHEPAVDREPPVREDEDDLAAESGRDLVLVGEEELAVLLAEVGAEPLGAGDHHAADHRGLALPEEGEDLVGAAADGHLGGEGGLDERLGELPHRLGVVRGDECREQFVADLALQMGRRTQSIHCRFLLPPLSRKRTPRRPGKEEAPVSQPSFQILLFFERNGAKSRSGSRHPAELAGCSNNKIEKENREINQNFA